MGELDVRRVSWSVTLRGQDPAVLDDAFGGLVETCAHALGERFPPGSGYETRSFQLSGPLEGTRLEVQRGRFTGLVSAQRYRRCHGAGLRRGDPVEVRLVASTKIAPRPGSAREDGRMSALSVAGCALGTITLGTLGLGVAGLVSTWGQALVLIPALVAWRTCTAISLSNRVTPTPALTGGVRPGDPLLADATARWNRVVDVLAAHRQVLDQQGGTAPFRLPAPCGDLSEAR